MSSTVSKFLNIHIYLIFQQYIGEDDDDYLYEVEKDLANGEEIVTVTKVWNEVDSDLEAKSIFHPSYIFLMLSSALIR